MYERLGVQFGLEFTLLALLALCKLFPTMLVVGLISGVYV
jgi:hypothetical protein